MLGSHLPQRVCAQLADAAAPVAGITNALQVTAGATFTCAVLTDGTITCWGDNLNGQHVNGESGGSTDVPDSLALISPN